jgi:predicted nucleic acid-binding protein
MKYVLDASVALKWVLPEALSDKARRLREDYRKGVHELLAPDIFLIEVAHALTRAERRRIIPVGYADAFVADILQTAPRLRSFAPLLPRAIAISSHLRTGLYDCFYIALAEQEGCELITADEKLARTLGSRFPSVVLLVSLM